MRRLPLAAMVLVAACAVAPDPRLPGSPAAMPESGGRPGVPAVELLEDAFAWSADRRLMWSDFRGRPVVTSGAVALTAYYVAYDLPCHAGRFAPSVVSRFLPHASWVKADHLLEPQAVQTLRHEQTHFDLSEVLARRALADLRAVDRPCDLDTAGIQPVLDGFGRRDAEIQRQYDRETGHGTDPRRQQEWDRRVETWLRETPR